MLTNQLPISRTDIGRLLVQPVSAGSVALRTTETITTTGYDVRLPVVATDPSAAWTAEGADILASDAVLDEAVVVPAKVAGLSVISWELAHDSSPAAATVVGQGLARDIARQIDGAFYGSLLAPAPPGLESVSGVQAVISPFASLDPFAEAISKAEQVGAKLSAFVCAPATALQLSLLRESSGSNRPLLGSDATEAGQRRVLGVDVHVSPAVSPGTVWGYDRARVWSILREDVTLVVDESRYFESDSIGVRATMRIGFGFAHPASIVKLTEV